MSSIHTLKSLIKALVNEAWDPTTRRFDTVYNSKEGEEEISKYEKKIKRNASPADYSKTSANKFDSTVDDMRNQPEFQSIEDFVQFKIDDEQETFDASELQALARNIDFEERGIERALPPQHIVTRIKNELTSYGLKFVAREKLRHFRGAMSAAHGTSPYAGFGGGGSGINTTVGNPHDIAGFGIGGGRGVVASGQPWDPNDKKNLPIRGSRR